MFIGLIYKMKSTSNYNIIYQYVICVFTGLRRVYINTHSMPLRIQFDALIEKNRTFDNSFDAIGQKKMAVNRIQVRIGNKNDHLAKGGV